MAAAAHHNYSLKDLASCCSRLEAIYRNRVCVGGGRGSSVDRWEERCVELIRHLAEMIIYGEGEGEAFFEYFAEKQMMGLLVALATCAQPRLAIQTQVLQTVSILVQNVRHTTSLYLLLSSNYVNALVSHGAFLDAACDEELRAHLVSLLKTLSLRLDPTTAQFFVDDGATRCPGQETRIRKMHATSPTRMDSQTRRDASALRDLGQRGTTRPKNQPKQLRFDRDGEFPSLVRAPQTTG